MKTYTLILFILINSMNATLLVAADKSAPKVNEVTSGIVINDSLKKLMEIDGVEPIYTACQKSLDPESDQRTEKIITCLWERVKADPKLKKTVQDVYAQELKGAKTTSEGRSPASTSKVPLTARSTNVTTDYESDPAVEALTDFYGKKLDAVLNPDVALTDEERKSNKILTVNHRQFIDLYKSELGKTIVSAFTSYCLDTDPETNKCSEADLAACTEKDKSNCSCQSYTISDSPTDRKKHREENIKSLKMADLKTGSGDSQRWQKCIMAVTKSCKKDSSTLTNLSETTKRSCLVMDYVNAARKNIIVADEQITFYNDMEKNQTTQIALNTKEITDLKKVSSDTLLEMSSTDVKTALEKPMKEKLKDLEGCYKDGTIVNVAACKKYLNTNGEENEMALAELGMRQIAQEGILEEELGSEKKVRDYLKEEGYSANDIEKMTADKESLAEVKEQILTRYKNQKAAIIKEMADRIDAKSTVVDGKITPKDDKTSGDVTKLEKIKTELESRSSDLQNLVYFNNVVSSYLQIDDGKGKLTRNTASLFAEANTLEKEQAKLIKEQIKSADLKDQKGAANTTNLDVNTINSNFLNYDTKEKKK